MIDNAGLQGECNAERYAGAMGTSKGERAGTLGRCTGQRVGYVLQGVTLPFVTRCMVQTKGESTSGSGAKSNENRANGKRSTLSIPRRHTIYMKMRGLLGLTHGANCLGVTIAMSTSNRMVKTLGVAVWNTLGKWLGRSPAPVPVCSLLLAYDSCGARKTYSVRFVSAWQRCAHALGRGLEARD